MSIEGRLMQARRIAQTLSSIVSLELSNTVHPVLDTATDSTIFHLLDIKQTGREGTNIGELIHKDLCRYFQLNAFICLLVVKTDL